MSASPHNARTNAPRSCRQARTFPAPADRCAPGQAALPSDAAQAVRGATGLLMRFGFAAIRGSNPRASAP